MESPSSQPAGLWSSVGLHPFQRALIDKLTDAGYPMAERVAVSQEGYRHARSTAARLRMRYLTYVRYPCTVARSFRAFRPRVAVVSSNTFFAPWIAIRCGGKRTAVVHWILDLYPDALIAAGATAPDSIPVRVMRSIMRDTFRRSAANVFLGDRLKSHAERMFGAIPNAHVIPVGADTTPFEKFPPCETSHRASRILYCGNLGRMHEIDSLIALLKGEVPDELTFEFRGNGSGMSALERSLSERARRRVTFGPNLDDASWAQRMLNAEVALVTMKRGAEGVIMPSKAYSALAAGQAILAVCPRDSDLADLVLQHDAGWVVEPGDSVGLEGACQTIATDSSLVLAKRRNAWRAGQECYGQQQIARQWINLFRTLGANPS